MFSIRAQHTHLIMKITMQPSVSVNSQIRGAAILDNDKMFDIQYYNEVL